MKRALKPEIKLGADRKKVVFLGGLLAVLVLVWLFGSGDSTPQNPAPVSSARPASPVPGGPRGPVPRPTARKASRASSSGRGMSVQEFRPTLKPKEDVDMSRVDPTLRLETLAKLRNVKLEGGSRSLFEFSGAPAVAASPIPKVAPIHPDLRAAATTGPVKPTPPAPPPQPPPPPPIPLKFYGYTNAQRQTAGPKRAFFLEGEDIFVAGEGELVKNRYKIIRIGVNSAVVEDTSNKNQQTLPLIAEMASS